MDSHRINFCCFLLQLACKSDREYRAVELFELLPDQRMVSDVLSTCGVEGFGVTQI